MLLREPLSDAERLSYNTVAYDTVYFYVPGSNLTGEDV